MKTSKVRERLLAPRDVAEPPLRKKDALSSGCTTLNLALTGKANAGFYKGKYYHWVGDSDSGKTWLTMQAMAEASVSKRFDDYQLIHDNPEDGALMDARRYFGSRLADRLRPPLGTVKEPIMSYTMEDFYYNIDDAMDKGPCIYVLDSLDALSSAPDAKKFQEMKKAARSPKKKGDKQAGSYGTGKAKANAGGMREVFNKVKKTGSILFIISQSKFSMSMFEEKTFSGGTALKFFCHAQLWLSSGGNLTTKVGRGKKKRMKQTGINAIIRVKKNRQAGWKFPAKVPIYWSHGADDTGSCVNFLLEEGYWTKVKGGIRTELFDGPMRYDELIQRIESENKEPELRSLVEDAWGEIVKKCTVVRKNKYGD